MGAAARLFGLGIFAAILIVDMGNVYITAALDRWIGLGTGFRISITPALLLSLIASVLFWKGSRHDKVSRPSGRRALLFGIALVVAWWVILATGSLVLLYFSIEFPLVLALLPFLAICYFIPRLTR